GHIDEVKEPGQSSDQRREQQRGEEGPHVRDDVSPHERLKTDHPIPKRDGRRLFSPEHCQAGGSATISIQKGPRFPSHYEIPLSRFTPRQNKHIKNTPTKATEIQVISRAYAKAPCR